MASEERGDVSRAEVCVSVCRCEIQVRLLREKLAREMRETRCSMPAPGDFESSGGRKETNADMSSCVPGDSWSSSFRERIVSRSL